MRSHYYHIAGWPVKGDPRAEDPARCGGSEEVIIAALLHDGPEDRGGEQTLERIREEFGDEVAGIVSECSDTLESPKPPWRERKQRS